MNPILVVYGQQPAKKGAFICKSKSLPPIDHHPTAAISSESYYRLCSNKMRIKSERRNTGESEARVPIPGRQKENLQNVGQEKFQDLTVQPFSHTAGANLNTWNCFLASPTKAEGLSSEPAAWQSATYSTEIHAYEHQEAERTVFSTAFSVITQNWKQMPIHSNMALKSCGTAYKME